MIARERLADLGLAQRLGLGLPSFAPHHDHGKALALHEVVGSEAPVRVPGDPALRHSRVHVGAVRLVHVTERPTVGGAAHGQTVLEHQDLGGLAPVERLVGPEGAVRVAGEHSGAHQVVDSVTGGTGRRDVREPRGPRRRGGGAGAQREQSGQRAQKKDRPAAECGHRAGGPQRGDQGPSPAAVPGRRPPPHVGPRAPHGLGARPAL